MKKITKELISFVLKLMLGWNKTITNSFLRYLKSKFTYTMNFDEVFVIQKMFKQKKDGILIDIGAHTGSFFENFLWKHWRVYAFEPDPSEFKQKILHDFQMLGNLEVFELAVSNKSGQMLPFYSSEESTGISSLHSFTSKHKKISEVRTIRLSDFIKEQNIKDVTILKVDTEGHDYFVLQGLPWDTIQPHFIMCEFEDRKTKPLGYDFETLGNYILNKGYKVFVSEWEPITKYGQPCKWIGFKEFPCKLNHNNGWGNFLCIHQTTSFDFSSLLNVHNK